MALRTSFRYRRLRKTQAQIKLKFITFYLGNYWFALSIKEAVKVILADEIFESEGDEQNLKIINYKNQEILLVDLISHLFPKQSPQLLNSVNTPKKIEYFVIIQNQEAEIVAFSIQSNPTLLLCEPSAIKPIPKNYLKIDNIQSISLNVIDIQSQDNLFLLDSELLIKNLIGY